MELLTNISITLGNKEMASKAAQSSLTIEEAEEVDLGHQDLQRIFEKEQRLNLQTESLTWSEYEV